MSYGRWKAGSRPGVDTLGPLALLIEKVCDPEAGTITTGRCTVCGNYMRADYFADHIEKNHLERRKT